VGRAHGLGEVADGPVKGLCCDLIVQLDRIAEVLDPGVLVRDPWLRLIGPRAGAERPTSDVRWPLHHESLPAVMSSSTDTGTRRRRPTFTDRIEPSAMRDGRAEKLVGVVAAGRVSRHNLADRLPSDDELEAMYGMRLADESLVQARGLTTATGPGGCEAGDLPPVPDGAEVAQAPLCSAGRAPETDQ
jgi:hypothetical protein